MTQPTEAAAAQAFFERHPHAALVLDASGRVLYANAAAAWLGADGSCPDFSDLTGVALRDNGDATSTPGWNRRLRVHAADGSSRQVDASLYAANDAAGDASIFCFVLRDVTASVQAARGTQEVESRSRVTTDSAPVLVWMARADMMRDWFNKSWLKFRGHTLGDELGEGWTQGVHPEDLERCLGIYRSSFAEHEPYSMDYRLCRHDGVYRHMLDTAIPRWADDGEFLGYIGTCVDITDRKELEDKLAEHTRTLRLADRRREDFLAKLSHELRNPLGPIANAAAILRTLERGNRNLVMVREIIERQVAQLRRLITELVDVTRITRGRVVLQREPVDIDTLIDSAVDKCGPTCKAVTTCCASRGRAPGWRATAMRSGWCRRWPRCCPTRPSSHPTAAPSWSRARWSAKTLRSACATPAAASHPSSCRASSSCSCRTRRPRRIPTAASAWA